MALQVPDYKDYIAEMTRVGEQGLSRSDQMFKWAQDHGISFDKLADIVSGRAGGLSDEAAASYQRMMGNWEKETDPLYAGQAADAQRMMADLPAYQEKMAGAAGADVDQAMDAAKKTQQRNLQGQGLSEPSIGQGAIDTAFGAQRAAAKVAAEEQARMAARGEARGAATTALNSEAQRAGIGTQQGGFSLAAGNQQINAPLSAGSTTAGMQQPGIAYYNAAYPWMKQWGDTMSNAFNQSLALQNSNNASSAGTGALLGGIGGGLLSFAGSNTGGKIFDSIFGSGSTPSGGGGGGGGGGGNIVNLSSSGSDPGPFTSVSAKGGMIRGYSGGGAISPTVPKFDGAGAVTGDNSGNSGGGIPDKGGIEHANQWMSIPGEIIGGLIGAFFGAPGIGMAAGRTAGTTLGDLFGGKTENLLGDATTDMPMFGDKAYGKGSGLTGWAGDQVGGGTGGSLASTGVGEGMSQGFSMLMSRGGTDNLVPPSASQSRGAITDDVPARLNVGEFVFPKDVVAWRGEQWMQKEIQKARQDRMKNEQAKPEMAPSDGAINMNAPTFASEGAQA